MTNEQIVAEIRSGISVTNNMQMLYENNLPLIRKFIKPFSNYGEWEDILQESYFGLLEAVRHYESSDNVRFMTYAAWWIRQSVQRYLENCGSAVRIPSYTRQKITRLQKAIDQIRQEQGREPTTVDLSSLLGVSVEEVQEIQGYAQGVTSLDAPLSGYDDLTLADALQANSCLENDTVDKIYDKYSENTLWGIVEHYVAEKENHIIKEIFLYDKSMSQVAREQGVTLERVRQLKQNGLRKLRMGKARRELREKFDIAEAGLHRGGLNNYREHGFVSIVEHIALKRLEAEELYEQHLRDIEEMHKRHMEKYKAI